MIAFCCKGGVVVDAFVVDDLADLARRNPDLIALYDDVVELQADDEKRPSVEWSAQKEDGVIIFAKP